MSDVNDRKDVLIGQYKALKEKKDSLEHTKTVKETEYNTVRSQYDKELAEACAKYGVKSLDELKALCDKSKAELEAKITEAEDIVKVLNPDSIATGGVLDL